MEQSLVLQAPETHKNTGRNRSQLGTYQVSFRYLEKQNITLNKPITRLNHSSQCVCADQDPERETKLQAVAGLGTSHTRTYLQSNEKTTRRTTRSQTNIQRNTYASIKTQSATRVRCKQSLGQARLAILHKKYKNVSCHLRG